MKGNEQLTDAELDALFKEADAKQAVPAFDDAFWGEVEAALPKKTRRGGFFWISSGAACLLVATGTIFFFMQEYGAAKTSTVAKTAEATTISADDTKTTPADVSETPVTENNQKNTTAEIAPTPVQTTTGVNGGAPQRTPKTIAMPTTLSQNEIVERVNEAPVVVEKTNPVAVEPAMTATEESQWSLTRKGFLFTAPVALNDVARTPGKPFSHWYTEFGVGYGQSYKYIEFGDNWMSQFRFAGGLYQEIGNMELSAGIALRAELPNNIRSIQSANGTDVNAGSGSGNSNQLVNERQYRGLYSIEFPMTISGRMGRSTLGGILIPGIQMGYSGISTTVQNDQVVQRERIAGSVPESKTMTMELGAKYMYALTERLNLTGTCTFDVVRPFQSTYYTGESRNYPVTFFVGLRRTFN